jgi:hypothetical protein
MPGSDYAKEVLTHSPAAFAGRKKEEEAHMFALRLVRLVEQHADQLAAGLLQKLKESEACNDLLTQVPESELKNRAFEIYKNVSDWLLSKSETEVEERYIGLGATRARQDVPFSQMLFALETVKEHLWEFLRQEDFMESHELLGEMELLWSLERFFDRISYFAAVGYESTRARQVAHALAQHQGGG